MIKTYAIALKLTAILAVLLVLNGCSFAPQLEQDLAEYHARLSRVLGINLPALHTESNLKYPSRQALFHPLQEVDITLPDFYSIQSCQLGTLVAQRNTTLGKQQDEAASWVYESALISALQSCIDTLNKNEENHTLAERLEALKKVKNDQLVNVWANLIQTSAETRNAFSQSPELLTSDANRDAASGINALAWLTTLPSSELTTSDQINAQLKILDSSRIPAKVWKSQRVITVYLQQLNQVLPDTLARIDCSQSQGSQQAEILRNVFYLFFIKRIQPTASQLNQFTYKMAPALNTMGQSPHLASQFKAFLQARDSEFTHYQEVMARHVTIWQTFLARCNLSPQAPN